ncbi:MAG: zeta toxin family protein [archaeon]
MGERKIIIIRGKVTAGKTTTSHELAKVLPGWILIDPWKIKEMFEPLGLKNRSVLKNTSKKAMVLIMREVIRNLGINIIVQETTQKFVRKHLRQDLKKHNYKLYSFFLDIDLDNAVKRDIQREKPTMGLGKIKTSEEWEKAKAQPDKEDRVIHTGKHKIKEVVDIILSETKEKRRKNLNAHLVRKCY